MEYSTYSILARPMKISGHLKPFLSILRCLLSALLTVFIHLQRFGIGGGGCGGLPGAVRNAAGGEIDFPLRILVQSDMVGAIIGRGGQTIRSITQQTR